MTMSGECYSCGVLRKPGEVFPDRRRGAPLLCADCVTEWPRELERIERCWEHRNDPRRRVMTRASSRARLRVRLASAQTDLVDLLVPRV
jgi:hypothetical protein